MAEWLSWTTIRRVLIAIPAIGLCTAAYTWLTLPDIRPLRTANPPTTAFMARREAETRSAGKPVHRQQQWVSFDRISKHLVRAVLPDAAPAILRNLEHVEAAGGLLDVRLHPGCGEHIAPWMSVGCT